MTIRTFNVLFLALSTGTLLSACGGGGGGGNSTPVINQPTPTYSIGGNVTGLTAGLSVVLQNNAGDALTVSSNAGFTFAAKVAQNSSYAVTVATQPVGQICTVNNGSGSNLKANISNVAVVCSTDTYTISGSVTGLNSGEQVTLNNNGANPVTVTSNTSFSFTTPVAYGGNYAVTVAIEPLAQTCTINNGTGTGVTAAVNTVSISCAAATLTPLASFNGATTDGSQPHGNLTIGNDGNFYGLTASGGTHSHGTMFRLTPGGIKTTLYSFAGMPNDGAQPYGTLAMGSDGNFYGITNSGGATNRGAIFKISPDGQETMIHSIAGGTNEGAGPWGSLTLGTDGNFYGMTAFQGAHGNGTIFKTTPAGVVTTLHSFAGGTADGANPLGSLTLASDGSFYGMTQNAGTGGNGTIFRITTDGTETTLYSFAGGTGDGANPSGDLTLGSDGNFYGMTQNAGASGNGTIFKVSLAGLESTLYSFAGGTGDGANPAGNLTSGRDGNFYGMTFNSGANGSGTIFMFNPAGSETTLYSFAQTATDGSQPYGSLTLGSDGNFYGMTPAGGASTVGMLFRF